MAYGSETAGGSIDSFVELIDDNQPGTPILVAAQVFVSRRRRDVNRTDYFPCHATDLLSRFNARAFRSESGFRAGPLRDQ